MTKARLKLKPLLVCLAVVLATFFTLGNYSQSVSATEKASQRFDAEYATEEEALAAAESFNEEIAAEGFTLLKNEEIASGTRALPFKGDPGFPPWLPATPANVSVFGKNTVNAVYGGSGSSGGTGGGLTIYESLANASVPFGVNPGLKAFYEDNAKSGTGRPASPGMGSYLTGFEVGETPVASYDGNVDTTFAGYKNAAIVMFSRIGGEGYDLPLTSKDANGDPISGRTNINDHYLMLDENEKDLLEMVKDADFDRVIVVINASQQMELGELEEDDDIHAIIWIGSPGGTGMNALGKIIAGDINPSGRTVDTYARDFMTDPAIKNFGFNGTPRQQTGGGWGGGQVTVTAPAGNEYLLSGMTGGNAATGYYTVEYEEGIYLGYRYWETRSYMTPANNYKWYDDHVVYPFGYGLSYTSFTWTTVSAQPTGGSALNKDGTITVNVKVKNTGSVAGKDVVQLYYNAPYTSGGIEKAHVVLGDFAKTKLLAPNEEQTLSLTLKVKDMASYDYNDANNNGHEAYELDAGAYKIFIGRNANHAWRGTDKLEIAYTVPSGGFKYTENFDGSYEVENRFESSSAHMDGKVMSRSNFAQTFPTTITEAERTVTQSFIDSLIPTVNATYDAGKPWYTATAPTQRETALTGNETDRIILADLIGLDYDDPMWDLFLNQLTIAQMKGVMEAGAYQIVGIPALGIPKVSTPDGPTGFTQPFMNFDGTMQSCFYVSPCVVAATWNKDIARRQGEMIGNEGLAYGVNGIYAPAMNMHRTPFSGRNFEYYSEDSLLSGKIGANVVAGMQSKGVLTYVKHFALNDQETNRDTNGILTWADEQTIRECYLKTFQMAVEEGGAWGIMSSFNRVGDVYAGHSYELLTEVLRNEWGFKGVVITDFVSGGYVIGDAGIRAGNDLYLQMGGVSITNTQVANTPTHIAAIRKSFKNIMYAVTQTNTMLKYNGSATESVVVGRVADIDISFSNARRLGTLSYDVVGELPSGLSVNSRTGKIEGIANAGTAGKYTVKINALIDGVLMARTSLDIIIPGLTYTGGAVLDGYIDSQYVGSVATAVSLGGDAVYYTLKNGSSLPAGLTLGSNGVITGTPTSEGTTTFTVVASVRDAETVEAQFTIEIKAATELPAGPQGPQGPEGPQGPAGNGCSSTIGSDKGSIMPIACTGIVALVFIAYIITKKKSSHS